VVKASDFSIHTGVTDTAYEWQKLAVLRSTDVSKIIKIGRARDDGGWLAIAKMLDLELVGLSATSI